jgi:pimeloyl-ACP methyl ester carboxylesterase
LEPVSPMYTNMMERPATVSYSEVSNATSDVVHLLAQLRTTDQYETKIEVVLMFLGRHGQRYYDTDNIESLWEDVTTDSLTSVHFISSLQKQFGDLNVLTLQAISVFETIEKFAIYFLDCITSTLDSPVSTDQVPSRDVQWLRMSNKKKHEANWSIFMVHGGEGNPMGNFFNHLTDQLQFTVYSFILNRTHCNNMPEITHDELINTYVRYILTQIQADVSHNKVMEYVVLGHSLGCTIAHSTVRMLHEHHQIEVALVLLDGPAVLPLSVLSTCSGRQLDLLYFRILAVTICGDGVKLNALMRCAEQLHTGDLSIVLYMLAQLFPSVTMGELKQLLGIMISNGYFLLNTLEKVQCLTFKNTKDIENRQFSGTSLLISVSEDDNNPIRYVVPGYATDINLYNSKFCVNSQEFRVPATHFTLLNKSMAPLIADRIHRFCGIMDNTQR